MDVQDFFYLAHYDNYFIDNMISVLINKKLLKKHYILNEIHYFDLMIELDEKFLLENFGTNDINDLTLVNISKACIQNAISLYPLSDILNTIRAKSNYYPELKNLKIFLKHDDLDKKILLNYYLTLVLVPDHLVLT